MKSLLFVSLLALCAVCLALSGVQARFLAAEEASRVVGGLEDFECSVVGDCDDKDPDVNKCPTGGPICTTCEEETAVWENCTVAPEHSCSNLGNIGDCGWLRYGSCNGSNCTMTLPTGAACDDVNQCSGT